MPTTNDTDHIDHVVIVGAGLAGATAAMALRGEGHGGTVTLFGDEPHRPYERPPLSKDVLLGTSEETSVFVHDPDAYASHGIDLVVDDPVVEIDRTHGVVRSASGVEKPFDRAILATGARPRQLPTAPTGTVRYLRTLDDARALSAALDQVHHIAVVGAGWIGCEVAAAARTRGVDVTLVDPMPQPLARVLGDRLGAVVAELHADHGVCLRLGVGVSGVDGTPDGPQRVHLDDGTDLHADLVVAGIGVVPNTDLAQAAGLEVANGVRVDAQLRTTDPRILAVGDVANHAHPLYGRLRVEHWANARHQARTAARNALGGHEVHDRLPYFFSDQYDLGLEYSGHAMATDELVVRGDLDAREFVAFWLRDDIVMAGMNVNVWEVTDAIQHLIALRHPVDRHRLADPDVPLSTLAQAPG